MRDQWKYYILDDDNRPVEVDQLQWAKFFEDVGNRIVDYTQITSEVYVSTVFLGLDHRHRRLHGDGPPILFETMVFGADGDDSWSRRYSSWDDAATGHQVIVGKMRAKQTERTK